MDQTEGQSIRWGRASSNGAKMINSHFIQGFHYEWRRRLQQGYSKLMFGLIRRLSSMLIWLLLLPVSVVLHIAGFRRVPVGVQRIGHLALEPDGLLKELSLGMIKPRRWILLAPTGQVANQHLLSYWEPFFMVIRGGFACFVIESMSRWMILRQEVAQYILAFDKAHSIYRIYSQWGSNEPLLRLSANDSDWSVQAFDKLGLPPNAWFVCIHNREPGFSPVDEALHAHRNGQIEALIPAIEAVVCAGGWVVRIGDPSTSPLPEMSHVIDYAHHPMKSDRLDVILCAKARFMIGNTSGISFVSSVFGVPCALVNMIPVSTLGLCPHDISIPKFLWSESKGRYLRFDEIMASNVANYRYASLYQKDGIRIDENSSDDILGVVKEMLGRISGTFNLDVDDEKLQQKYLSLFKPHHYSYGASSKLGSAFLRKYSQLLKYDN